MAHIFGPNVINFDQTEFEQVGEIVLGDIQSALGEDRLNAGTNLIVAIVHLGVSVDRSEVGEDVIESDVWQQLKADILTTVSSSSLANRLDVSVDDTLPQATAEEADDIDGNSGAITAYYWIEIA